MSKDFAPACIAAGLVLFSPAALASSTEFVTDYGPAATFNGQELRVYLTHNDSQIGALGVEVPAAMYEGAPMDPPSDGKYDVPNDAADPDKGMAWYCCGYEIVVDLPESALKMSAFRKVVLNWNPQGHVPPGVYTLAHTDFHFYFMSEEERLGIGRARDAADMCMMANPLGPEPPMLPFPQNCDQIGVTAAPVPPEQMPPGYQSINATEPAMGNHLLDPAAHEFHGQPFDHTHIYMTNAGKLTGMEPMITLEYLRSLSEPVRVPISVPAAFPEPGMYPTEYVMEYDRPAGVFRVSYENWKLFPGSSGVVAIAPEKVAQ